MAWRVTCKARAPRGFFRRDGVLYVVGEPVVMEELTKGLKEDLALGERSMLLIEEVPEEERMEVPEPPDLAGMTLVELKELARRRGVRFPSSIRKRDLIPLVEETYRRLAATEEA